MVINTNYAALNSAKYNSLVRTGTAMLAQANALPQIALKLIG